MVYFVFQVDCNALWHFRSMKNFKAQLDLDTNLIAETRSKTNIEIVMNKTESFAKVNIHALRNNFESYGRMINNSVVGGALIVVEGNIL